MIIGLIYKVTNLINDKVYIGQTIHTLSIRKRKHLSLAKNNSNLYFHKAVRKYGEKNFKWDIICRGYENALDDLEKYFIIVWL